MYWRSCRSANKPMIRKQTTPPQHIATQQVVSVDPTSLGAQAFTSQGPRHVQLQLRPGGLTQRPFLAAAGALPTGDLSALHQKFGGDASVAWRSAAALRWGWGPSGCTAMTNRYQPAGAYNRAIVAAQPPGFCR